MKIGAFVMYPGHAVLLIISAESRRILIYNRHSLMGSNPVEYEEDYCTLQGLDEKERSGNTTITETSELAPLSSV